MRRGRAEGRRTRSTPYAARFANAGASHRPGFLDTLTRHIDKGAGFKYEKALTIGERDMIFKLGGPVHRKRLGLGFQIRF